MGTKLGCKSWGTCARSTAEFQQGPRLERICGLPNESQVAGGVVQGGPRLEAVFMPAWTMPRWHGGPHLEWVLEIYLNSELRILLVTKCS